MSEYKALQGKYSMTLMHRDLQLSRKKGVLKRFDVLIVGGFLIIMSLLFLAIGVILLARIGSFFQIERRQIIFGLILISTEKDFGLYYLFLAVMTAVSGYTIITGYRLGWWLALTFSIYHLSDSILILLQYPHQSLISICIDIIIVIWLILRRKLYLKTEQM